MLYPRVREAMLLVLFFTALSACHSTPLTADAPDGEAVLAEYGVAAPSEQAASDGQHFTAHATRTGSNATLIVPAAADLQIGGAALEVGDEIAVFTREGLCAGMLVWEGENAALTIWGDDPMTEEKDGLTADEPLHFRVWDASAGTEYDGVTVTLATHRPYLQTSLRYYADGIYVIDALEAPATQPTASTD